METLKSMVCGQIPKFNHKDFLKNNQGYRKLYYKMNNDMKTFDELVSGDTIFAVSIYYGIEKSKITKEEIIKITEEKVVNNKQTLPPGAKLEMDRNKKYYYTVHKLVIKTPNYDRIEIDVEDTCKTLAKPNQYFAVATRKKGAVAFINEYIDGNIEKYKENINRLKEIKEKLNHSIITL